MLKIMVTLGLLLLTAGCASVLNEDKQTVSVRAVCYGMSMPAQCVAENSRGRWTFNAPKQIEVSKDMFDLKVTCKSAFVDKHTTSVRSGVQVAMAGNVLLGGLVGGAVDVATARGLQYPARVDVVYPSCN
jgi:uncharacterized protein YceK